MKVKIVFENEGMVYEVPLKSKIIRDIYDMAWYCMDEDIIKDMDANGIDVASVVMKFGHLVHDVLDDGKTYKLKNGKFIPCKERYYVYKKPKWKSIDVSLHTNRKPKRNIRKRSNSKKADDKK